MKLFHSGTSPYVRKVMLVLHHTRQLDKVELVPGSGTPLEPNAETIKANPLGKVPCLITEDGQAIYDSRVICRYLDHRVKAGLYPEGDALFPVLTAYEWRLRPEDKRYQPWVDGQVAKVERGLKVMETNPLILEGALNAAKIAAGAALGYVDMRQGDLGWRDKCPKLAAWYAKFSETPEMKATMPVL